MNLLKKIYSDYFRLPQNIHFLILLELSLSLIHVAFILVLNILLRNQGFSDPVIASFNSLRFISALAFALPLGIYIRGKRLKPFFIIFIFLILFTFTGSHKNDSKFESSFGISIKRFFLI